MRLLLRSLLMIVWIAFGSARSATGAAADPAYLVKDINTDPARNVSSSPADSVTFDGIAYFTADDGVSGRGLWRSDGTTAGTYAVAALNSISHLAVAGGALWFTNVDGPNGCAVWRSDGTANGTHLVRTISSGDRCFDRQAPQQFTTGPGGVYFSADDGQHGGELWVSDGTANGTHLVADLRRGSDDSTPEALTQASGGLYFFADDGGGRDLWRTDGTEAGTVKVRDIGAGPAPQFVPDTSMRAIGDTLVFAADDGVHGLEPWISDGSAAGTQLLVDTIRGSNGGLHFERERGPRVSPLFRVGAALIFFVDQEGMQVWRTTGTAAGTRIVGAPGRFPPSEVAVVGNRLFYSSGPVISIVSDSGVIEQGLNLPRLGAIDAPIDGGDAAYFRVINDERCELWRSDGTAGGLLRVVASEVCGDAHGRDGWTARAGMHVLFGGGFGQLEPYVVDETPAGAHLLRDINDAAGRTGSASLRVSLDHGGVLGDLLLFQVYEDSRYVLWRSDGTADGTWPLLPLSPSGGAEIGGRFVFPGSGSEGTGIWSTDGSPSGTTMLVSLRDISSSVATDEMLFALARDEPSGAELWTSDGTIAGTGLATTLGPSSHQYAALTRFGDGVAYVVCGFPNGQEVWWWRNGQELRRLGTFPGQTHIEQLVEQGGALYFAADGGEAGVALWRSDGSVDGAVPVTDLQPPTILAGVRDLTAALGGLLFAFTDDAAAVTPWFSDGTAGGTRKLGDLGLAIPIDEFEYESNRFAALGDAALFAADDGEHGTALWRTDGSVVGTTLVRDIDTGVFARVDLHLTVVDGVALFTPDSAIGTEVWRSDGTAEGTYPLADIAPGRASSVYPPTEFVVTEGHVFFTASDGQHGQELWALPRAALAAHCAGDCDHDGAVTIDELVRGVATALNGTSHCIAFDRDGDGVTTIAELVRAVRAALGGCDIG